MERRSLLVSAARAGAAVAFIAASTLRAPPARAACPPRRRTASGTLRLAGEAALIVTHPTSAHDARLASKRGTDEAVRYARNRRIPVVYLQDDGPEDLYFVENCAPDHWVASEGGEIDFASLPGEVLVAGGHLELCLSHTLHDVLLIWARQPGGAPRRMTLTYLMDAIYSNGREIEESEPWYDEFRRFMAVVTYGRPAGEHWPKLTLLETLGLIRNEAHEIAYLTKTLPHWARTIPEGHRVELVLNESSPVVLRDARGWNPPTLRFHFVDSAVALGSPRSGP